MVSPLVTHSRPECGAARRAHTIQYCNTPVPSLSKAKSIGEYKNRHGTNIDLEQRSCFSRGSDSQRWLSIFILLSFEFQRAPSSPLFPTSPAGPPEPRRLEVPAAVVLVSWVRCLKWNPSHWAGQSIPPGNGCGDYRAGRPLDFERFSGSLKMGNSQLSFWSKCWFNRIISSINGDLRWFFSPLPGWITRR